MRQESDIARYNNGPTTARESTSRFNGDKLITARNAFIAQRDECTVSGDLRTYICDCGLNKRSRLTARISCRTVQVLTSFKVLGQLLFARISAIAVIRKTTLVRARLSGRIRRRDAWNGKLKLTMICATRNFFNRVLRSSRRCVTRARACGDAYITYI